jgi:phosphoglycolate phosphatase-like HAD superfamily hydrolase
MKLCICDLDGVVADSTARFERATTDGKINWKVAFNPELIPLDGLIDGVPASIERLSNAGYSIIFLTSRPEPMESATLAWLNAHGIACEYGQLITKTKVWKAREVARLIRERQPERTIFVEDEIANVEEVTSALPHVQCFLRLEDAE